ncbi:hypothetical protein [Sphingomonas sp. PP-CC-3G-468]|uniref:hypothetical protein n=1 Tax=Sphingomonas sp. PP-CC-3G-468 TaxID=2135656 RepID=UPI00104D1A9A|nr:hypothetical protein [Sphingomonas sp. PP-CC-3G-468]
MAKPNIIISIDTSAETETADFGRAFIENLCHADPRLVPERLSTTEGYKEPFLGIDDFVANWWAIPIKTTVDGQTRPDSFDGPSWKRKSTLASRGMISHGITDLRHHKYPSGIWYECRWVKDIDFNHLFDAWVRLSNADIGMLHVFTDREKQDPQTEDDSWFETGSFGGPAKPGLPNMGWAMAYGANYAAEVDVVRIRSEGFPVDEIDGVTVVRVTDKLSDVVDDFEQFSRRRAELKALFRPSLFWIT